MRGHVNFRAVVRTSEPWAHKPLGAGSSVLSSKDFRPQLELRHVLIRTDKHVCGFVHKSPRRRTIQQACSESPVMCGPSLSLNQSSAHPQSSEPQGGHAFEEGDSSRRVEVAP